MITATFTQSSYADAYGLWQWDYGQILRIQGLSLPTAVEIHFSLQSTGGESVTRIGITKDGVTDVLIPDAMLEAETSQNYDIYAFIYLTDEVSGETRHRIRMPVKARPKPSGRTLEEEVGKTAMAAIVEAVNTAIAGKADSMEISGHTLLLKSGETTIDEIDIPAVSEEADGTKEVTETIFNFTAEEDIVRIDPVEIEPNSYKKIVVIIQTKANASGAFVSTHSYVILNGRDFDMWNVVSSSIGYGIFVIDLYNGYSVLEGKTSRGQSSGAGTNARYISESISRETMIQTIGFSFATAAFSAGSTIRVTGVRA